MSNNNYNNNKRYVSANSNIPIYERTFLSSSLLSKFPQYKPLFHKCPNCAKFSLKPRGYKKMNPAQIKENDERLERECSVCGFVQKPIGLF